MNDVIRNMMERRSIRKYTGRQVAQEALNEIVEAGLYAPNGGSKQHSVMVVSQDREVNRRLGTDRLAATPNRPTEGIHVSADQPSILDDRTITDNFYGAPTLVTVFGLEGGGNPALECAAVAENIMLAAHSLGVGSCIIGEPLKTFETEYGQAVLREWGVPAGYAPYIHVVFGYASSTKAFVKPRREGRVLRR